MVFRRPPSDPLGITAPITRRDFVNGTLAGSGAALVAGCAATGQAVDPALAPSGSKWTGFGGVGDYAWSNGNTEAVVQAAHGIRDHRYPDAGPRGVDEQVDLAIVGGGFSGMTVAYEFVRRGPSGRTCLLLDNHPVPGGEAKQNEFVVDGRRLTAPQGSNAGLVIGRNYVAGSFDGGRYDVYADYYRELGFPTHYEFEPLAGGAQRFDVPNYHFGPMAPVTEASYETGYYFRGHGWVRNPARDGFAETPWPAAARRDMDDYVHDRRDVLSGRADAEAWLDTITYYDLLDRLGYGEQVRRYVDPYIAVSNFGVCGNAISALAAKHLGLPGTKLPQTVPTVPADVGVVSFPGGNAAILRTMLSRVVPGAVGGDGSLAGTINAPLDLARLDRAGAPARVRLGCTVFDVRHEGNPGEAGYVLVTYARDGQVRRVRARAVVMASGGWVNRNVVADLPDAYAGAYADFHYGPVLTANVAVRNWRFFDKLGFINARWFDGPGWQVCVRRNVVFDGSPPLTPHHPTVLTFYMQVIDASLPAAQQGPAARARLLGASYAELEHQIRAQMSEMFAPGGFDARRDIAGMVLNRWGHAFLAPQPGFFLGRDGAPPPSDVLRQPHGRIAFAHSELQGLMNMAYGMTEAKRAAGQVMAML